MNAQTRALLCWFSLMPSFSEFDFDTFEVSKLFLAASTSVPLHDV